jgi:hypothetical protein
MDALDLRWLYLPLEITVAMAQPIAAYPQTETNSLQKAPVNLQHLMPFNTRIHVKENVLSPAFAWLSRAMPKSFPLEATHRAITVTSVR